MAKVECITTTYLKERVGAEIPTWGDKKKKIIATQARAAFLEIQKDY